jgi:molybdopterin/thiamine biosynthesis adenylyltransferase
LRDDQIRRYARHVLLPEVGGAGQRRLFAASALVRDASGAGQVALAYLAAAGVGTLVVADERPVAPEDVGALFELSDVGRPRREAARARVRALNPDVRVAWDEPGEPLEIEAAADGPGRLLAGARAALGFLARAARG